MTLLMFTAKWLTSLKIVEEITKKLSKELDVQIFDVEENEELAKEYFVDQVPTFIFLKNNKFYKRFSGFSKVDLLRDKKWL